MEGEGSELAFTAIRLGRAVDSYDRPSVGFKPLTEMVAADRYKGEDGGLYGGSRNDPPPAHLEAARRETARIEPLSADGKPAKDGAIALVSISMASPARAARAGANAATEFTVFKELADKDTMKSPPVAILDGAQGGVVRWLIQDQINGDLDLNFDPGKGAVKAPLLLWGPYLWADGMTPRKADGLIYERKDLLEDGTFPSDSGRRKVADMLLAFFRTDPLARSWYLRN
jgi:hypothetical protein